MPQSDLIQGAILTAEEVDILRRMLACYLVDEFYEADNPEDWHFEQVQVAWLAKNRLVQRRHIDIDTKKTYWKITQKGIKWLAENNHLFPE